MLLAGPWRREPAGGVLQPLRLGKDEVLFQQVWPSESLLSRIAASSSPKLLVAVLDRASDCGKGALFRVECAPSPKG